MKTNLKIGQTAYYIRTITDGDVYNFESITGDRNPLCTNELYWKEAGFTKKLVQNIYIQGLISATLGAKMPGFGSIYLEQETQFLKNVFANDTVIVKAIVEKIIEKKNFIISKIKIECYNQDEELVATGTATVIPPTIE
ncbi:MAG: MaoC family dehydratase [Fusobacteria bacterium]|nr:MaoC family dehydratase [Fusobacteriota bacterium]